MSDDAPTEDNQLTQLQQRRNADSAVNWDHSQSHRQRVTQLIVERLVDSAPQLCVLGAGNCNDLDLQQLRSTFDRIDLVDIDGAALRSGLARQELQTDDSLRVLEGCDLTGVWSTLAAHRSSPSDGEIDALVAQSQQWPGLPDLGTYGTVVSACLLSQLLEGVINSVGESHPRCLEVIAEIRRRHLQLLCELTAPGGHAVLITDFVSSDTAPMLQTLAGKALSDELKLMIRNQNFFTGLNPLRLQMVLHEDPTFSGIIDSVNCELPWLWNFGPRHYAVTAISFRKC